MIAFCRLCGLAFRGLDPPSVEGICDLGARLQQHLAQDHPEAFLGVAAWLNKLGTVVAARAFDWGGQERQVQAALAELRSGLMDALVADSIEANRPR